MMGAAVGALVTYVRHKHWMDNCRVALDYVNSCPTPVPTEVTARGRMQALMVARDTSMLAIFSHAFAQRAISARSCSAEAEATSYLSCEKFEAIVADFDEISACADILANLPHPNKHVLVYAIATSEKDKECAHKLGAAFLISRPLNPATIRDAVCQGYGRMLRDGQSYFRWPVELPVSIRRASGAVLQSTTMNLSRSGMAIRGSAALSIGEEIGVGFAIPNSDVFVAANGRVIWDDKHGKSGISFVCTNPHVEGRFAEWLDDKFFMERHSYVDDPEAHLECIDS